MCFLFLMLYPESKSHSFITNAVRADILLKVLFNFQSTFLFFFMFPKNIHKVQSYNAQQKKAEKGNLFIPFNESGWADIHFLNA